MTNKTLSLLVVLLAIVPSRAKNAFAVETPTGKEYTNSIGMKFVRIEPGVFQMGFGEKELSKELVERRGMSPRGDYDEHPTHEVTISRPFYMGVCEVINAQCEQFSRIHEHLRGKKAFSIDADEAVVFVSWHDAKAFCDWLSEKEGLPYRLPTEAEWEYACRAGTNTFFWTGDSLPAEFIKNPGESWYPSPVRGRGSKEVVPLHTGKTTASPRGLYDMHGNVEEWCYDWYGPYENGHQTDPVGRVDGDFKVTRGGSHGTLPYYLRSANRMGTIPEDKSWFIGFRVVIGELPHAKFLPVPAPQPYRQNVNQAIPADVQKPPDAERPYFRGPRNFVKIPEPSNGPLFHRHNHCPAIVQCPNGDLLAIWYTTITENGREIAVAASRFRYGTEEWQPASPFWDPPDRNDSALALWSDDTNTIYHFNSLSTAATWGPLAVIMRTSVDNGVTWSKARLIIPEHDSRRQVAESVFQTKEGYIVLPCDASPSGSGGTAVHISRDNGLTWHDASGTIAGIHGGVAQLRDGRLIAFGRGDEITEDIRRQRPWMATRIAGDIKETPRAMTMSISADMGKTWTYQRSIFPSIGGGQRVAFMRLKEGPLLLASFAGQDDEGRPVQPVMVTDSAGKKRQVFGLFAALSYDDGRTWPAIRLVTDDGPARDVGTTNGRTKFTMSKSTAEPRGYLSVCQAANGVIHLVSSWNHYAFNIKWIEAPPPTDVLTQ
ncbi:MAG TPA: SUMF1/EgtB/PvdO family nonheme iron enzyme [Sedimentisphaerales bacterium]|nr:SUMF1/EgtB/PvdO family nonheme iron enzyme [Sedimentisphaerales bacterium]